MNNLYKKYLGQSGVGSGVGTYALQQQLDAASPKLKSAQDSAKSKIDQQKQYAKEKTDTYNKAAQDYESAYGANRQKASDLYNQYSSDVGSFQNALNTNKYSVDTQNQYGDYGGKVDLTLPEIMQGKGGQFGNNQVVNFDPRSAYIDMLKKYGFGG